MSRLATLAALAFTALALAACHPPSSHDHPDAGGESSADAAGAPTMAARIAAAQATATTDPRCAAIAPFYWQIGDAHAAITDGSVTSSTSTTTYQADSPIDIASATKLVFGAYVVERFQDDLGAIDHRAMTMQSGYVSLSYASCVLATTVDACFAIGHNGDHTVADDDRFDYDGGHFQHYASVLGLGGDDNVALAAELGARLGTDLGIGFSSPQLAAGMRTTPDGYARFLRKILGGGLAIRDHLGEAAVCTLPGPSCPTAAGSPSPYAWHYSYGHWIEDDPAAHDDGAFSSPGAFGFYPWIDAGKTYYGLVARKEVSATAYKDSVSCGRAIRAAFMAGVAP